MRTKPRPIPSPVDKRGDAPPGFGTSPAQAALPQTGSEARASSEAGKRGHRSRNNSQRGAYHAVAPPPGLAFLPGTSMPTAASTPEMVIASGSGSAPQFGLNWWQTGFNPAAQPSSSPSLQSPFAGLEPSTSVHAFHRDPCWLASFIVRSALHGGHFTHFMIIQAVRVESGDSGLLAAVQAGRMHLLCQVCNPSPMLAPTTNMRC